MMAWLLLVAHVHYFMAGLFMTKKELANKSVDFWASELSSDQNATVIRNGTKMVMMLVDALREDFVHFEKEKDAEAKSFKGVKFLEDERSLYRGKQIELFSRLAKEQPENAILLPMEAAMPTVTTVRIKAIMTGAISSFFETKEDFASESIPEDSVLHQVKNFNNSDLIGGDGSSKKVVFTGDHIWLAMFG